MSISWRHRRTALRALSLAAAIAAGCGGERENPTGSSEPTRSGTIVDRATRLGVAGARVEVVDGAGAGTSSTTDDAGRFRLEGLAPGTITVLVSHPSYLDERQTLATGSAAPTWSLRPRPCDTATCGSPTACNRLMPFLQRPFMGEHPTANQFDHDTPEGVAGENGTFVNACGRGATYDGHNGYDWSMRVGTPILAAGAGVVTMAGPEPPFRCAFLGRVVSGTWIRIEHIAPSGEKFWTEYGHLSTLAVTVGQRVAGGDVIAASGNTGCSTAPHLHFTTLRETGNPAQPGTYPTDPYGWQGAGEDPWGRHPSGAYSAWLWAEAPPSVPSAGAAPVQDQQSPAVRSLGRGRRTP